MEALFAGGALVLLIFLGIIIKNLFTGGYDKEAPDTDPLVEAEDFLADGRHEQAIQLLEKALAQDDSRSDIKLKLDKIRSTMEK